MTRGKVRPRRTQKFLKKSMSTILKQGQDESFQSLKLVFLRRTQTIYDSLVAHIFKTNSGLPNGKLQPQGHTPKWRNALVPIHFVSPEFLRNI